MSGARQRERILSIEVFLRCGWLLVLTRRHLRCRRRPPPLLLLRAAATPPPSRRLRLAHHAHTQDDDKNIARPRRASSRALTSARAVFCAIVAALQRRSLLFASARASQSASFEFAECRGTAAACTNLLERDSRDKFLFHVYRDAFYFLASLLCARHDEQLRMNDQLIMLLNNYFSHRLYSQFVYRASHSARALIRLAPEPPPIIRHQMCTFAPARARQQKRTTILFAISIAA